MITFARDENGQIKTKQPCQTPGCSWPNWHVCLLGKPDTTPQLLKQRKNKDRVGYSFTDSHRQSISDSMHERWEHIRLANRARDEVMVQMYINGASIRDIREKYDLGYRAVITILRRAENKGLLTVRKQGEPARKITVSQ